MHSLYQGIKFSLAATAISARVNSGPIQSTIKPLLIRKYSFSIIYFIYFTSFSLDTYGNMIPIVLEAKY